ncbi:MAG: 7-cyano-7-deazaguanine synthase QueC [Kiritimatiellia bacterium]|jgi:7-cyano-7-deazaguanine synthase|nr:7-cyano-7-deazaguanine synthase QueC [Kiritimatiellia bacterium]MDP6848276.1 7-cyano-7-deazaguanine synthase QueC [Kiritimatiellia bacterium]
MTTSTYEGLDSAVVLLSGGLDSSTLLHFVSRRLGIGNVRTMSFLYGQKHSRELEMAKWQADNAGVVEHREADVSSLGDMIGAASALTGASVAVPDLADIDSESMAQPPTYVPNRNMILLSLAAAYAESNGIRDIFYGAQAQDRYGYWDCTSAFLNQINAVLALNRGTPVRVHAPFVDMSKADVVKIGLAMGVDYSHTWTCYRGGGRPCGTCPSCMERLAAFEQAGAVDPSTA